MIIEGTRKDAIHKVLDNPIWNALTTADAGKNIGTHGLAYLDADIAPFMGLETWDERSQRNIVQYAPDGRSWFLLIADEVTFINELEVTSVMPLYQYYCPDPGKVPAVDNTGIVPLDPSHAEEMVALTALTKPGPFRHRTIEFGNYHGIFEDGKLVAMGGERLHIDGYTEVSAICTHPDYQGRGYGARIVTFLTNAIISKKEIPFLHAKMENTTAMKAYIKSGYEIRKIVQFYIFKKRASILHHPRN
jgi:ribosomal protein S18 acetylase RimI-like enzyme